MSKYLTDSFPWAENELITRDEAPEKVAGNIWVVWRNESLIRKLENIVTWEESEKSWQQQRSRSFDETSLWKATNLVLVVLKCFFFQSS